MQYYFIIIISVVNDVTWFGRRVLCTGTLEQLPTYTTVATQRLSICEVATRPQSDVASRVTTVRLESWRDSHTGEECFGQSRPNGVQQSRGLITDDILLVDYTVWSPTCGC